jgi:iron complex outermembrane receptor protein
MKIRNKWLGLGFGGLAVLSMAGAAYAQLDEIIVTAQKKEQNLQKVPVSVTAFTGDSLSNLGMEYAPNLVAQIPNVTFTDPGTGIPTFAIRGVQLFDYTNNNEAPVGFYVDEVYYATLAGQTTQFFDMARIEVLRGPQGILYGRNTTGGLIHLVTQKPTDEFEGHASFQYGSFKQTILEAAVNIPITDRLRTRIAGKFNRDDGWQKNLAIPGQRWNATDTWSARGLVDFDVTNDVSLLVNVHGGRTTNTTHGYRQRGLSEPATLLDPVPTRCSDADIIASLCSSAATFFNDPSPKPDEIFSDRVDPENNVDNFGASATINWDLGGVDVTSITAYEYVQRLLQEDGDASPVPFLATTSGVHAEQFSQELRLAGDFNGVEWLLGGYYFRDNKDNSFISLDDLIPFFGTAGFQTQTNVDTEAWAVFANMDIPVTDELTIFGGVRYSDEENKAFITDSFAAPTLALSDKVSKDKITWRAGVEYQATDDLLFFGSYSTGFKSGQFNTSSTALFAGDISPVGQETVKSAEIGMKSDWFDDRLRLNVTGFYTMYEDFQVRAILAPALVSSLINAGKVDVMGAEIEATAQPFDNFLVTLGVGILDTEIDAPGVTILFPVDGNELPNAPRLSLNGVAQYSIPTPSHGTVTLQADFNYQGDTFFQPGNQLHDQQKAYALLNLRVGWVSPNEAVSVNLFVENVTDKEYVFFSGELLDYSIGMWGKPLTAGVEVGLNF